MLYAEELRAITADAIEKIKDDPNDIADGLINEMKSVCTTNAKRGFYSIDINGYQGSKQNEVLDIFFAKCHKMGLAVKEKGGRHFLGYKLEINWKDSYIRGPFEEPIN